MRSAIENEEYSVTYNVSACKTYFNSLLLSLARVKKINTESFLPSFFKLSNRKGIFWPFIVNLLLALPFSTTPALSYSLLP